MIVFPRDPLMQEAWLRHRRHDLRLRAQQHAAAEVRPEAVLTRPPSPAEPTNKMTGTCPDCGRYFARGLHFHRAHCR
jgi:hypothetical protein